MINLKDFIFTVDDILTEEELKKADLLDQKENDDGADFPKANP